MNNNVREIFCSILNIGFRKYFVNWTLSWSSQIEAKYFKVSRELSSIPARLCKTWLAIASFSLLVGPEVSQVTTHCAPRLMPLATPPSSKICLLEICICCLARGKCLPIQARFSSAHHHFKEYSSPFFEHSKCSFNAHAGGTLNEVPVVFLPS